MHYYVFIYNIEIQKNDNNMHYTPPTETLKHLILYFDTFLINYNFLLCILLLDNM